MGAGNPPDLPDPRVVLWESAGNRWRSISPQVESHQARAPSNQRGEKKLRIHTSAPAVVQQARGNALARLELVQRGGDQPQQRKEGGRDEERKRRCRPEGRPGAAALEVRQPSAARESEQGNEDEKGRGHGGCREDQFFHRSPRRLRAWMRASSRSSSPWSASATRSTRSATAVSCPTGGKLRNTSRVIDSMKSLRLIAG